MSFQQRNVSVSLASFSLILVIYIVRVIQMFQSGSFNATNVFRLWGIVIAMAIVVTIAATILAHIGSGILQAIKTQEEPVIEGIEDERDKVINLKGTRITYIASSFGVLLSMLTFVFGQPPLVMFALLIFSGIAAQIAGDISRLYYYRKGF